MAEFTSAQQETVEAWKRALVEKLIDAYTGASSGAVRCAEEIEALQIHDK